MTEPILLPVGTVAPPTRPVLGHGVTWAAIVTGVVSGAISAAPYVAALADAGNPLDTLFGHAFAAKLVAFASIIAVLSVPIAGAGKSVGPRSVNPPTPPADAPGT